MLELATEYPPADEQLHIDSLIQRLRAKMEADYGKNRILRDAHPKMHGCVRAQFTVDPHLPPELRVGIFSQDRTFPAWIRFSNQNNRISPDSKGDIRGVALKLMGVGGEKLLPNETQGTTHDFILISDDRFVTKDVAEFDALVKALMGGVMEMLWFSLTHLRAARNLWTSLKHFTNPLAIRYFSVAPYMFGKQAVKYSLRPRDAQQTAVPANAPDDYLREAMVNQLSSQETFFDFAVQFQVDPVSMPIEDAGVTWDEAVSPFRKLATITIPPQVFDTVERVWR